MQPSLFDWQRPMRDPFLIEGPASIGVSGGRTSGRLFEEILRANGGQLPPNVHALFQNTGEEDERTLEFIQRMEDEWGAPITWLEFCEAFDIEKYRRADGSLSTRRQKRDLNDIRDWGYQIVTFKTASRKGEPFDMMLEYYAQYRKQIKGLPPILPNVPQRICTAYLKIKLSARHMKVLGFTDFDMVAGIRADEPRRYHKMQAQNMSGKQGYEVLMPLYEAGITSEDVTNGWKRKTFDLQLDPKSEAGNCGLCYLKKRSTLIRLMRSKLTANREQGLIEIGRWVDREKRTGQNFRRDRPNFEALLVEALTDLPVADNDADEPVIDCFCGEA
jgi:3'-phosphoadenosine 5'-phosphosulfate sulfotransferase (PAPS reductase)/FAD synthetase